VEYVIEKAVSKVLADSPLTNHHRVTMVDTLVKALENDAGWVDLYGITGELNVPGTLHPRTEDSLRQLLEKAMKVHTIYASFEALATKPFLDVTRAPTSISARRQLARDQNTR
jgi:hypothetical protein